MVFDKYTKKKANNCRYWLLLINKYFNYINQDFFDYADKY